MRSMCLNAKRYSLSGSFAIPGITTTANANNKPATKEHNRTAIMSVSSKAPIDIQSLQSRPGGGCMLERVATS